MAELRIQTKEKHRISPYLYMQFMEPLGDSDTSVDAGYDFVKREWRPVLIDKVRKLNPSMVRFGGCFASYYRWKEAVGPWEKRVPVYNHNWGGVPFHNLIGTKEVIDFTRLVNAEPLFVVNSESDGRLDWAYPENGENRLGTAEEAAEWVRYCNDPDDALRISHGDEEPYGIRYWQIGNETSLTKRGFSSDEAVEMTKRFVSAMREADPSISLIAWGEEGDKRIDESWCPKMAALSGVDMVAFHHHFRSGLPGETLFGTNYRKDPDETWMHLMNSWKSLDEKIIRHRAGVGSKKLAMTEGHYNLPGRNRNEVLSSWGAGVSYARCLNTIHRHSDVIEIATMADFFGTRWQVNAILLTTAGKRIAYFQPVATVMALFKRYQGDYALDVTTDSDVDCVASRSGNDIFLHLANTDRLNAKVLRLKTDEGTVESVEMEGVSVDSTLEVTELEPDVFAPRKMSADTDKILLEPAAVACVKIHLKG